eukprot:Em0031g24a
MELRATHNAGPGNLPALQHWQAVMESTPPRPGHALHQWSRDLHAANSHHSTTTYTNPDVVDAELGKEITAGWIINDHINIMKAKIDLKAAFHLIPVRAVDWVHLGMDRTCLPFGLRSALSLINNYANWIMARNYGAQLLHYTCQEAMYSMLLVCDQLGIPVASEKLKGPTTTLTFLGIVINMSWLVIQHKATKRELLSLIGKLSFAKVAPAAWSRQSAKQPEFMQLFQTLCFGAAQHSFTIHILTHLTD